MGEKLVPDSQSASCSVKTTGCSHDEWLKDNDIEAGCQKIGDCFRRNGDGTIIVLNGITLDPQNPLPQTHEELKQAFPKLPNNNGRPARRIIGGGNK